MLLPKIAKISRGSLEFIHVKRHRSEALGDIRADLDPAVFPHVICDAARLPFSDQSFDSVLCDPPYNGKSGGITMSFQNCPELRTNGLFFSTGSCQQIHTAGGK